MSNSLYAYLPVLLLFGIAVLFVGGTFLASALIGRRRATMVKSEPFECGIRPAQAPGRRVAVKYYMIAISFVLFDMEVMFLLPWALVFRDTAMAGGPEHLFAWQLYTLAAGGVFLAILTLGLVYEWLRGGLQWD